MPIVSVCIPVVRPDKAQLCIDSLHQCGLNRVDYEVVTEEDKEQIGCPKMVKKLVERCNGEYVVFLGDDTTVKPNCLKIALDKMKLLPDGWGQVGLVDPTYQGLAIHWMASMKLLPLLDGEFFHTGYNHICCDNELQARCIELERFILAPEAEFTHETHINRKVMPIDEHYKRANNATSSRNDLRLYWHRKRNNWQTQENFIYNLRKDSDNAKARRHNRSD